MKRVTKVSTKVSVLAWAALATTFGASSAFAQVPSSFSYFGEITKPDGTPLTSSNVSIIIRVVSPGAEDCVLYDEQHTVDLSSSGGRFDVAIGKGLTSYASNQNPATVLTLAQAFTNGSTFSALTCASGTSYTPAASDSRKIRVLFNDNAGSNWVTISPDHVVHSVPYAQIAQSASTLGGVPKSGFLQTNNTTAQLTQGNLESVFQTAGGVNELLALINGTSTQYAKSGGTTNFSGAVTFTQAPTSSVAPTTATQLANKQYCDSRVGGIAIDSATLGTIANNQMLKYSTGTGKWVAAALTVAEIPSLDASKITTGSFSVAQLPSFSGDVMGGAGTGILTVQKIQGRAVSSMSPTNGQVLMFDGTQWAPSNGGGGGVSTITVAPPLSTTGGMNPNISLNFGPGLMTNAGVLGTNFAPSGWSGMPTSTSMIVADDHYRLNPSTVMGDAYKYVRVNPSGSGYELRDTNNMRMDLALGTAAVLNAGSAPGNVCTLDGTGRVPASAMPSNFGFTGKVGIGNMAPASDLDIVGADWDVRMSIVNQMSGMSRYPGISITNFTGGMTGNSTIMLQHARGSQGAPAPSQAGDILGAIFAMGHDGTSFGAPTGAIEFLSDQTMNPSSKPTAIAFLTASTGMTTKMERMRIDPMGRVGVGTSFPQAQLHVAGQILSTSPAGTIQDNTSMVDWNMGNAQTYSGNCGTSISMMNFVNGGSYTLAVTDTSTTMCSFTASGMTFKFQPANSGRTASSHTIYRFQRLGNTVYVKWESGYL